MGLTMKKTGGNTGIGRVIKTKKKKRELPDEFTRLTGYHRIRWPGRTGQLPTRSSIDPDVPHFRTAGTRHPVPQEKDSPRLTILLGGILSFVSSPHP
ncbi:MAG: hypothetical protein LBB98_00050 [Treponema sp.]|nr:hypothetical protein [Treponema sp.]